MSASWRFALLLTFTGCTESVSVNQFPYGVGQPGLMLAEGGEIRHENVRILGNEQTWVMVYQYTAAKELKPAPFAVPADSGKGEWGNCVDERNGAPTWPFTAITGATYLTLPKVQLSGPGITGALDIVQTVPPNKVGNSTFRHYDFTYGGGAPGDVKGFNASKTTTAMAQPGADYTIDIGKDKPMTYHMPSGYLAPLGIGGAAMVKIPKNQELTFTWIAPTNDKGASGNEHKPDTYFNFTLFADPMSANPPQFICFPDVDGHQVIPLSVINAIPDAGLIVNADLSHFMESREANPGEFRRIDLVSIYCNISAYSKQ